MQSAQAPPRAEESDSQYNVFPSVWGTTSNASQSGSHPKRGTKGGQYRSTPPVGESLILVSTPQGKIMWVHPDLMEGQQWTTVTSMKSKGKVKVSPCNVVCASSREAETDVPSLTDSEEETIVLATKPNAPLMAGTRSGQLYLKKYNEMMANPPKPTQESTKQSTKQLVEKQKELRYAKSLLEDKNGGIFSTLSL